MTLPLLATATLHFLAVARTGSITEAAEFAGVAPSAVSRQVAKLESALGVTLFERQARGMALTPDGERLAEWARASLSDAERAVQDIRAQGVKRLRRLRLACTEGMAASFVPRVMALYRTHHPEVGIDLRVGTGAEVSAWLLEREVDLGFKFALFAEKGFHTEFRGSAPIVAAVSPAHPLFRRSRLTLSELLARPIAISDSRTTIHQALERTCQLLGLRYEVAYTGNLDTLMWLAVKGEVPILASHLAVAEPVLEGKLKVLLIQEPEFALRQMYLLSLQGGTLPDMAKRFVDYVRSAYPDSAAPGQV